MPCRAKLLWILFLAILKDGPTTDGYPKGPWRLAFKAVSGKWNASVTGSATLWKLFTSTEIYSSGDPIHDQRDFTTTSDHFKSSLVEEWNNQYISVQAIKLSFFKNNSEKAYIVFNGVGKTKTTWFKCANILYSSYTDLNDTNTLGIECPGKSETGLPLTIMKDSYLHATCPKTTGWAVVADTNLEFSLCSESYLPVDGPKPYFKYSSLNTVANLTTQLETADSIGIFFQVWDMVFKGVEGIQPADPGFTNVTGLFMSDLTENDNSDHTVQNIQHTQTSKTFKSQVINLWDSFHIERVKFAMFKGGVEKAFVVFDGINTDMTSWFSEDKLLYSSYGDSLKKGTDLAVCSIAGDSNRNWQIQSKADINGCGDAEQLGWTLVKESMNNGTCSWDLNAKKKPYFQYNVGTDVAVNPANFQFADVMAVFVKGWRLALKVSASGSVSPKSSVYTLWTETGSMNENDEDAMSLSAGTATFKSSIIDQWTTLYIRAVRIAAYKDGAEVFHVVFDATGSSSTDWLDCGRILYTSVSGLDRTTASASSYTCSLLGDSSTFRFMIGKAPDCSAVSMTGMFAVVDIDSNCSARSDLPQFLFSNTFDDTLTNSSSAKQADTFAVFLDMANCYTGLCQNGATCQDIGGNYRCICPGQYYGNTCANLDGVWSDWSDWAACTATCGGGMTERNRTCTPPQNGGKNCTGKPTEVSFCNIEACPAVDGNWAVWSNWSSCTKSCGTGDQLRSRTCTNPTPAWGGQLCTGNHSETKYCNVFECPVDGGWSSWINWVPCYNLTNDGCVSECECGNGHTSRNRSCDKPNPEHGGKDCTGNSTEIKICTVKCCGNQTRCEDGTNGAGSTDASWFTMITIGASLAFWII